MKKLDKDRFDSFINTGNKVVEFSADWCVDCKRVAPDMPGIAAKFASQFEFGELDVDESRTIAEEYNVKGIPTFIVFKDGKEVGRLPSRYAKTKEQIEAFLEEYSETKE
ncbi:MULTISPECIES: co-chaperone YbbN [Thermoactinomyces]|jgi:thioredoxin-like negative regulator of GroEL|uniref:Thioredoxin n=1 Tax=Thermoactinomyces daqus TaxID=1329516 RepID=A0A7W1XAH3_9BACL|nr:MULTISPECIES: thioredoxin family protein [Thermoactinomyces]MBA4543035.1 thioredoxin family protein [Thermoactinomyces daqus]MBH8598696.1 thioredoxin family protein [Thermoactinomyces sp. CICC 10523]MBH8605045.1 thioredoxin family protein [Thermoactinomyces sp. CICC 10522]